MRQTETNELRTITELCDEAIALSQQVQTDIAQANVKTAVVADE